LDPSSFEQALLPALFAWEMHFPGEKKNGEEKGMQEHMRFLRYKSGNVTMRFGISCRISNG
jgi:hypothetical protein